MKDDEVRRILKSLTARERRVLEVRFGLELDAGDVPPSNDECDAECYMQPHLCPHGTNPSSASQPPRTVKP